MFCQWQAIFQVGFIYLSSVNCLNLKAIVFSFKNEEQTT